MTVIPAKYEQSDDKVTVHWSNMSTGDTASPHTTLKVPNLVMFQMEGTFGGATANVVGSLSGVSYNSVLNQAGTIVTATANTVMRSPDAFNYWKPEILGGSGDVISIYMTYWT